MRSLPFLPHEINERKEERGALLSKEGCKGMEYLKEKNHSFSLKPLRMASCKTQGPKTSVYFIVIIALNKAKSIPL